MRAIIVCLVFVVGVSMAQRSPYAPRPVGYPEVLNRFKGDEDNLPNRVGGTNTTTATPQDQGPLQTPDGSIGDPYLLQQVPKWPREHQPFWYLNQQHIMNHRGQAQGGTQAGQQPSRQQGGQASRQPGGQLNTQQGGQASRQPIRQQGGQASRQQGGVNTQQAGQASRQQGGQVNTQQAGQATRRQETQQWNNQQ